MRTTHRLFAVVALFGLFGPSACLPYTVGSTAQTVPAGRTTSSTTWYFIPNAFKEPGDTMATPLAGSDMEWRQGVDARSDVGVRITPGAGAIVNSKHRFHDEGNGAPALAYMVGTGIVNAGEHMHLEATLIASGDEQASAMPFGGMRAMQVIPITQGAVHDSPTLGAFGGVQLGDASFTIRPELGVYYDRSALGVRSARVIFVPAITIQRNRHASESRLLRRPMMNGAPDPGDTRSGRGQVHCHLLFCPSQPGRLTPSPLPT